MKTYSLYLKSHIDYPDYEREVVAKSKDEAIEIFLNELKRWDWTKDMIKDHVIEIN